MRIYAVAGVPPEIQAYAMARYSRSARSMLESIGELSRQRASDFLNTFYFQYGHRSIADLAHLALAIEDISILAATRVVDENLWDGQERSTRYQQFRKSGYVLPGGLPGSNEASFRETAEAMFAAYEQVTDLLLDALVERVPRPADMEQEIFRRTLRARAFDVARALLPLATRTSLGQIVSARVLERQVSRLLSEPYQEVRQIGLELRAACERPAEQPLNGEHADPSALAPTLVKYANENPFQIQSRQTLTALAAAELAGLPAPDRRHAVELAADESPLDETVATVLYRWDRLGHSYRQVQEHVRTLSESRKRELLAAVTDSRGQHDELPRELRAGYAIKLDLLMDFGSFRDLHRHRRCVQIIQEPTAAHGADAFQDVLVWAFGDALAHEMPTGPAATAYTGAVNRSLAASAQLEQSGAVDAAYLLPLAARTRVLFKMDLAELGYIVEERTPVNGHFSYRRIAWAMRCAVAERFPHLVGFMRGVDPAETIDLLRR
ncbi:MAG: FAD-dependent thymidylate synthase [Chloroflexota bacterium]